MATLPFNEKRFRQLLKSSLAEVLEERRDLLRDAVLEAMEDIALVRAIKEGERTRAVGRHDVLAALNGGR